MDRRPRRAANGNGSAAAVRSEKLCDAFIRLAEGCSGTARGAHLTLVRGTEAISKPRARKCEYLRLYLYLSSCNCQIVAASPRVDWFILLHWRCCGQPLAQGTRFAHTSPSGS